MTFGNWWQFEREVVDQKEEIDMMRRIGEEQQ